MRSYFKHHYFFVLQEAVRNAEGKPSATEPFVFQTEITGRDKDHVRIQCSYLPCLSQLRSATIILRN